MPHTVAIVQARSASSRLPGKSLSAIEGKPLLQHILERTARSCFVREIVVATTVDPADDQLTAIVRGLGYRCVRGSEHDVLERFVVAARESSADVIVRVTADDPLKDPTVIDLVIAEFQRGADYASNTIRPTYPEGLDIEVFSRAVLERAFLEAHLPSEREHVTPYIWTKPELFTLVNVTHSMDLSALRWTVDYAEDLEFVRQVYARLYEAVPDFTMEDILRVIEAEPQLSLINSGIKRNEGYERSLADDVRGKIQ